MQDKQYVMALDAGTTSNRAIIFDNESHIVSVSQKEFTQYFPKPGWVEHDANEIFHSMVEVMREALAQANMTASEISAIGITNQRETTVVWDKNTGGSRVQRHRLAVPPDRTDLRRPQSPRLSR